jgi:hypothetical protein
METPCPNFLLDSDEEPTRAPCGDEGRLCDACYAKAAKEHEWLARAPRWVVYPWAKTEEVE